MRAAGLPSTTAEPDFAKPSSKTFPAVSPTEQYAPGPIRRSLDDERVAVEQFRQYHPEYDRLSQDEIVQAMATYLTDDERRERNVLEGEGVLFGHDSSQYNDEEDV